MIPNGLRPSVTLMKRSRRRGKRTLQTALVKSFGYAACGVSDPPPTSAVHGRYSWEGPAPAHFSDALYDHGLQAAAHLRKPGTALAIFALRWGAHAHGTLRDAAREAGVPYLLHPAGLNPNQVAWQVMRQVSDTLTAQVRA